MRKRCFFFDIDGTLAAGPVDGRYVPDSARYALDQLRRAGHEIAICTGRAHAMARSHMDGLGIRNMVSDGGNGIVIDGELVELEPLEREPCIRVLEECERKGMLWGAACEDTQERLTRDARFVDAVHDTYMNTVVDPAFDFHAAPCFYKLFIPCSVEEERTLESLADVPTVRFSPYVLFVEPADKGRGVRRMMEHFGLPAGDAVVFGDGTNDLSMFLPEWTCVAMGNAIPQLKERADYVTADVDKDGILLACRHFGWIE